MARPMLLFGFPFAIVLFICCKLGSVAAYVALGAAALAIISYIIIKKIRNVLEIPLTAGAILLSAVFFLLFWRFSYLPAAQLDGATAFTGKIVSLPHIYEDGYGYEIKTFSIDETFTEKKLMFFTDEKLDCTYYDCISVSDALVYVPREDGDIREGYFSRKIYLAAYAEDAPEVLFSCPKTPYWYILNLREKIITTVQTALTGDRAGVVIAMIMGDTGYITPQTITAFNNSGAAHLLAVSGFNVSLWTAFIIAFLTVFAVGGKLANILSMGFLVFFSALTGFCPSIVRASVMLAVILAAPVFKRRGDALNSLGLAVFAITAVNPFAVLSVGFQLSVTATLGIVTLGQTMMGAFANKTASLRFPLVKRLIRYFADIVIITLTAFVSTLPIMVEVFGRVSLIAPVTNLCVIGLSSLITMFGGTGVLFSYSAVFAPVANLWFAISNLLSGLVLDCVNALGSLKYAVLPVDKTVYTFWFAATALLLLGAWAVGRRCKTHTALAAVSVLCLVAFVGSNFLALMPTKNHIKANILALAGTPVIVLQSGRHYALVACPRDSGDFERLVSANIPAIPTTALDLLLVIPGTFSAESYTSLIKSYAPETVFADYRVYSENTDAFKTAADSGYEAHYFLWDEINLYFYDTDDAKCVIIEFNNKRFLVSLSDKNDMVRLREAFGAPDTLICTGGLPQNLYSHVPGEIVITGGLNKSGTNDYTRVLYLTENVWYTAMSGTYELIEKGASRWDASTRKD